MEPKKVEKKMGHLLYISSTKCIILVGKKEAKIEERKSVDFSPNYSIGTSTLWSQLGIKIHILILDSVGTDVVKRLSSSHDGVHLGPEKDTCRQDSLSYWID
jgi:hypothetical protein